MLNRVVLTGRLTRDPELTYTQSGTPVLRFSIAVDRQFKNRETGRRDADFINCVIWRTSAENFARFTHKGALVGLDGRLSTSNYENQQGQRVYRTEVTVENFALLEPRSANNGNGGYNGGGYNNGGNGFNNQDQSFGNNAYGNGGNFGAAPQNNFGGSPAPANQSYNGNFNQPQEASLIKAQPKLMPIACHLARITTPRPLLVITAPSTLTTTPPSAQTRGPVRQVLQATLTGCLHQMTYPSKEKTTTKQ